MACSTMYGCVCVLEKRPGHLRFCRAVRSEREERENEREIERDKKRDRQTDRRQYETERDR